MDVYISFAMSKAVAPMVDLKIERHCPFDTFVSRVDQRTRHASGLAIHGSARPVPDPRKEAAFQMKKVPKTRCYKEVQQQYKDRVLEDPQLVRNREARANAVKLVEDRLRAYQKKSLRDLVEPHKLDCVDLPPNPQEMAIFRYSRIVGPPPCELFPPHRD